MSALERLSSECLARYPEEAARVLERLPPGRAAALFEELDPDLVAGLLAKIVAETAASTVEAGAPERAAAALSRLHPNAAAHILRRCETASVSAILERAPGEFAHRVRGLLAQPAGRAGALADAGALALPADHRAEDALREIRRRPEALVHYLYVLDRDGRLAGAIDPVALIAAEPAALLGDLARRGVPRVGAEESASAIAEHRAWSEWAALAVVNDDGRFVGALPFTAAIRLRRKHAGTEASGVDFGLSLAELLWLGLTGVTEGIARVAERSKADE